MTLLSASPGIADPVERAARYDADHELAERLEADGVASFCDWWLSQPLFAPLVSSLDSDALARTRAQRSSNSAVGLANSLRATGTGSMPPLWAALGTLRSPLLAVAGALDPKFVHLAQEMVTVAPFGRAAIVQDAGHVVHIENHREVSRLLRIFLEGCETAAS